MVDALWPDVAYEQATMRLHAALRSVRTALRQATGTKAMFVTYGSECYSIDGQLMDVDLWRLHAALVQANQAVDPTGERAALAEAALCYQGPLGEDSEYPWAESHREEIRRAAVDALTRLAALYEPSEGEQALALLDRALKDDRHNEQLYQRVMRMQARMGRPDAVRRTFRLLEARLDDLELSPGEDTLRLTAALLRRNVTDEIGVGSTDP